MECMWHCCFFSPAKVALFGLTVDMLSLFWEVSRGAEWYLGYISIAIKKVLVP